MIKMVKDLDVFVGWYYKNDFIYVIFFSCVMFQYLVEWDQFEFEFIGNDVILLRKIQ